MMITDPITGENAGAAGSLGQSFLLTGGTGNQLIDGVLAGVGWTLPPGFQFTYSFPASAGVFGYVSSPNGEQNELLSFSQATANEQAAFRSALALVSQYTPFVFTEITETASTHANFRLGNINTGGTGTTHGYYPNGFEAMGDIYMDLSDTRSSTYTNPVRGDWGFATIMHELGHTLGLKHGQDNGGPGFRNGTPVTQFGPLPTANDSWNYSLMTYRSYQGASTTVQGIVASDNPTSYMQSDIAALQFLYGANFNTNSGATTYSWNAVTGEMSINGAGQGATVAGKIFQTIWDGNGTDTYDTSNFANNQTIDLRPGAFSTFSTAQLVDLDKNAPVVAGNGNIANALLANNDARSLIENAITGAGADAIIGNAAGNNLNGGGGNDTFTGGAGADTLNGDAGVDAALYSGARSDYAFSKFAGSVFAFDLRGGSPDGLDRLQSVEQLRFANNVTLGAEWFTPGDFNADLRSDLVWTNSTTGLASTFLMNGTTISSATLIGGANGAGWQVRAEGDLNGDGSSDLVWQNGSGLVVAWLMNGTAIGSAVVLGNATDAFQVALSADLDGDGRSDIVLQDGNGQAVGWLMNGGTITAAAAIGAANGAPWRVAAAGDLNLDGRADLIWNDTAGRTVGYLMNGLAIGSASLIANANGSGFSVRGVGDMNGDGRGDIVWQFNNGQAGVWTMNGTAIQSIAAIGGANGSQFQVRDVADLNGDGLMDLVWQDITNGQAVGFLMNGSTITAAGAIGGANGSDWLII